MIVHAYSTVSEYLSHPPPNQLTGWTKHIKRTLLRLMTCYIGHDSQMTDAELLDERKIVDRSTRLQTTQCEDYILSFFASEGRS